MWACPNVIPPMTFLERAKSKYFNIPVAVLDLRPEAVEKMVEAVARALVAWERNRYGRVISGSHVHPMQARAALQAILPLRKRGKR